MARTARKQAAPTTPAARKAKATATTPADPAATTAATPEANGTATTATTPPPATTEKAPSDAAPPEGTTGTEDPTATLAAAYWRAMDQRDEVTGTLPAEPLDAVKVAYRAVPKRDRGDAATSLGAEAAARMVAGGTVDTSIAIAMGALNALFTQLNAERPTRQTATAPHDPVPGVAGLLTALDLARDGILANLTDDQRDRVAKVDVHADTTAFATAGTALAAVARISDRTLNGRRRPTRATTGARTDGPARDLAKLVRDALDGTTEPMTLGTIARDHNVSTGALDNRWTKNNIEGVTAVHDANGRKAFQAA